MFRQFQPVQSLIVPARILIGGPEVGALVPHVAWVVRAHAVLREDGLHPALRGRQLELRSRARAPIAQRVPLSTRGVVRAFAPCVSLSLTSETLLRSSVNWSRGSRRAGVVVSVCCVGGLVAPVACFASGASLRISCSTNLRTCENLTLFTSRYRG